MATHYLKLFCLGLLCLSFLASCHSLKIFFPEVQTLQQAFNPLQSACSTLALVAGQQLNGHQDGWGENVQFSLIQDLVVGSQGQVYVLDVHWLRQRDTDGKVSTLYTHPEAFGANALQHLALTSDGQLYLADSETIYLWQDGLHQQMILPIPLRDLAWHQGKLYGLSEQEIWRLDPDTGQFERIYQALGPVSWRRFDLSPSGDTFTLIDQQARLYTLTLSNGKLGCQQLQASTWTPGKESKVPPRNYSLKACHASSQPLASASPLVVNDIQYIQEQLILGVNEQVLHLQGDEVEWLATLLSPQRLAFSPQEQTLWVASALAIYSAKISSFPPPHPVVCY